MKLVDLNDLLYAVNRDAHHHAAIRQWWEDAISGNEPIGLTWAVLLGFLRLATNSRVFPNPLSLAQAIEHVSGWLSHPNVCLVVESSDHWGILRPLLEQAGTGGNLTTDAHLASLAISHGAVLASCDADFRRFDRLQWENPLASGGQPS